MKRIDSERGLMAGLFIGGCLYAFYVIIMGRWTDPFVIIALYIELILVVASITARPPNKKILGLLVIFTIIYIAVAFIVGYLSEVVVMASGGVLLYGAMKVEPKFPVTKRAVLTGLIVGVVMTFLGIYIALKLGVIYFVGAEMLGALILGVHGRYTPEENTIVVAIANGSSMIAIGVLIVFPAIAIFEPTEVARAIITYPFIVFITGLSAVCGMLILTPLRERFENEPWPQVKPQAECILALGADESAKREVIVGMTAAGLWVGAARIAEGFNQNLSLSSFPNALSTVVPAAAAFPDWVGVSNSPLIASMGFFMGWKRVLVLFTGSVASLLIWVFLEGAAPMPFATHLQRPEILYLALGVFASVIAGDLISKEREELTPEDFEEMFSDSTREISDDVILIEKPHKASDIVRFSGIREDLFDFGNMREEILEMVRNPREYLVSRRGRLPTWVAFVSLGIFIISGLLVFWIFRPFGGLTIDWLLIVLGSPLALVSAYFTARAISETGMLAGYISDIIAIPAIAVFRVGFSAVTTFMSMLGALQDSAIALLVHLKLGRLTGVRGRDIAKAVFIGAILGTFGGSLITIMIYENYGFGGTDFPSPSAQLFGFLVISLQGLVGLQLPGTDLWPGVSPILVFIYLISYGVVGYFAGRELSKRKLSSISLAVGVLIPPSASIAMLFGGFIDYRLKKRQDIDEDDASQDTFYDPLRDRTTRLLSGIVAGEAVAWILSPIVIWLTFWALGLMI